MLNFVCRDQDLHQTIIGRISDIFPCVMSVDIPEEVNKVIFASKSASPTGDPVLCPASPDTTSSADAAVKSDSASSQNVMLRSLSQAAKTLDKQIRSVSASCDVELADCVAGLQVLSVK